MYIYIYIVFFVSAKCVVAKKASLCVCRRPRDLTRSSFAIDVVVPAFAGQWKCNSSTRKYRFQYVIRCCGAIVESSQSHPPDTSWPDIGSIPGSRCSCVADPFLFMVAGRELLATTLSSVVDGVSGAAGTTSQHKQTTSSSCC